MSASAIDSGSEGVKIAYVMFISGPLREINHLGPQVSLHVNITPSKHALLLYRFKGTLYVDMSINLYEVI